MAERAIWSGAINFGLVTIPVKLHSATENKGIAFHQIHSKCKSRIQEKRWCPTCDRAVEWDEIEKGFEYSKGKYVAVSRKDLDSLPLPTKDAIVIEAFVKLEEIDPIYFDKNYYLLSDEKASRPFSLFMNALREKEMVAIGSFAIRSKERLCCLRPVGGTLLLDTLFYPDEIKVDLKSSIPKIKVSEPEMKMVSKLIDMMAQPFDVKMFKDNYRAALQKIIDAKLEGQEIEQPDKKMPKGQIIDLMEALQRSLKGVKNNKTKTLRSSAARRSNKYRAAETTKRSKRQRAS